MNVPGYSDWMDTAIGLHMVAQMMGKTKLARLDPQPEWRHITLEVTARGLGTGLIPNGDKSFSVELNLREGRVEAARLDGRSYAFVFENGLAVSDYYAGFKEMLTKLDCATEIYPVPQEVAFTTPFDRYADRLDYDSGAAADFHRMCVFARNGILRFVSPFRNKKLAPVLFWGTFDTTGILFSGRPRPFAATGGGGVIERVAFDEEMIEFGFWPGDEQMNDPAFFILPYPFLKQEPAQGRLEPARAWYSAEKAEFFLKLEDLAAEARPEEALQDFFRSGYRMVSRQAGWPNLEWYESPLLTGKGSAALRGRA